MNIVQSTTASALEAAIRARIAIDPQARETVSSLAGKVVDLCADDTRMSILFEDGRARVSQRTDAEPDLTLRGSVIDVGKLLLSNQNSGVTVEGDEALLSSLHKIFKPSMDSLEVAERAKATAEYGVATARSAFEGLASEFTTQKSDHDQVSELATQLSELRNVVNQLEDRIKTLEDR